MTQIAPVPQQPEQPEVAERKVEISRVRVITGPYAIQYQVGKLWPQGERQTQFAVRSYEAHRIREWLHENMKLRGGPQWNKYETEYQNARKALDKERDDFKAAESPIECMVAKITKLNGDQADSVPAYVEVIGAPFGKWFERQVGITEQVPVSACVISTNYPMEELLTHIEELESEDEEDDEEEEEGEEDVEAKSVALSAALISALGEAMPQVAVEEHRDLDGVYTGATVKIPIAQWASIQTTFEAYTKEREAELLAEAAEE